MEAPAYRYSSFLALAAKENAFDSIGYENIKLLRRYLEPHRSYPVSRHLDLAHLVLEAPIFLKELTEGVQDLQCAVAALSCYVLSHDEVDNDMIAAIAGLRDSLIDMEQSSACQRHRLEANRHLGKNSHLLTSMNGSDANSSVSSNPSSLSLAVMPTTNNIDNNNGGSVTHRLAADSSTSVVVPETLDHSSQHTCSRMDVLENDNHLSSSINGSNATSSVHSAAVVGDTVPVGLQSALPEVTTLATTADNDSISENAMNLDEEPLQSLITSVSEEPEQSDHSQQRDSAAAVVSVTTAVEDDVKLTVCSLIDSVEGSNTSIIVSSSVPPSPPLADGNIATSDDANSTARPGTSTSKSTASSRTARPWPRAKLTTTPLQAAVSNSASSTAIATRSTDRTLAPALAANRQMLCVEGSSAVMPIIPIPPPPPLATGAQHSKRPTPQSPRQRRRTRTVATATVEQREPRREVAQDHLRQRGDSSTTQSTVLPLSTSQHRALSSTAPRSHPHPTRRRLKGKGAAARRKEKRQVEKATAMSSVFSSTLRSQAVPFVPNLPHAPASAVSHVIHWIHHVGLPWAPWDIMNCSQPYFF